MAGMASGKVATVHDTAGHPVVLHVDSFWAHIPTEDLHACWMWRGYVGIRGYGRCSGRRGRDPVQLFAHRVCWELVHGPIPPGLQVCHNCPGGDRKACVNPAHLFLATPAAHMADTKRKGQLAPRKGEASAKARLTDEHVMAIRTRFHHGESGPSLAKHYAVHPGTISQIVRGRIWKHLAMPADVRCGRNAGTSNPAHRLTENTVREIRQRSSAGESCTRLAAEYGVVHSTIRSIALNLTWKHL